MASLQLFGRNLSRTTGQSSNQNPCKFVKLKQSSHTWGLAAPPPSLRLADRRREGTSRASEQPAFEFDRDDRGSAAPAGMGALALAPRLGGRPALEQHVRPRRHLRMELGAHGNRPGRVQAGHSSLGPRAGPLLHRSAGAEAAGRRGLPRRRRLPGSSASSCGGRACSCYCCCCCC